MEEGLLLKGVGGWYTVLTASGDRIECNARGLFRKQGITPVTGDRVKIVRQKEGGAYIMDVLPRKNTLLRPVVANIDQLVIVLAASVPKPDLMLVDKLLIQTAPLGIEPVIVINKCDILQEDIVREIMEDYGKQYRVVRVSAKTGMGIEPLSEQLDHKISCFAGQSAAGKSSLLNALMPQLQLKVGGLTRRIERGKHTTRHAQLWPYRNGAVLDTPGFSLLDVPMLEQQELDACYPEFQSVIGLCRFAGCSHISEPDCMVKQLVNNGALSKRRYERYVQIATQLKEMRRHQYD